MKKKGLLYAAAAACCIAIPMHAENFSGTIIKDSIKTRHELKIGLGFGAHQLDNSRNAMTDVFLQKYHLEGAVECGNIYGNSYLCNNLEYHYRLNNHLEIGGFVATGLSDENYENPNIAYDDPSPIAAVAYEHCNYIAFAPSLRYIWCEEKSMKFYSRIAVGIFRHHLKFNYDEYLLHQCSTTGHTDWREFPKKIFTDGTEQTKWGVAWQMTAIGVNMGNSFCHFFCELGYGCLGVFSIGLSLHY